MARRKNRVYGQRLDYRKSRPQKLSSKRNVFSKTKIILSIFCALFIGYMSFEFYNSFLQVKDKFVFENDRSLLIQVLDRLLDKDLPIKKEPQLEKAKTNDPKQNIKRADLDPGKPEKIVLGKRKFEKMSSDHLSEKDRKELDELLAKSMKIQH